MGIYGLSIVLSVLLSLTTPISEPIPSIQLLKGNSAIPIMRTDAPEDLRADVLSHIARDWNANERTETGWYILRSRSSRGETVTNGFRLRMRDDKTVALEILDSGVVRLIGQPSSPDWRSVESTLKSFLNDDRLNNLLNNGR